MTLFLAGFMTYGLLLTAAIAFIPGFTEWLVEPLLKREKAKAWDEGHDAASEDADNFEMGLDTEPWENPYKKKDAR